MRRRRIRSGETVEVRVTARDRELFEHTLADPDYVERLQPASPGFVGRYTLDDLEDILGYIAAEANHTKSKRLRMELEVLYDRLLELQRTYDDGGWGDSPKAGE